MNRYKARVRTLILILWAYVLYPYIYLKNKFGKKKNDSALKILVIPQLSRVGDLMCSTPVFRTIKEEFPNCYLSVLVSQKTVGVIKNNHRIDEIIIFENYSIFELIKYLRRKKFNWSFSLVGTSIHTLIVFLSFIPNRVKTQRENRPMSEILTDGLSNYSLLFRDHTYLPGHYLRLLKFIGIDNIKEAKEINVTPESREKILDIFKTKNIKPGEKLVGISITAGNKIKEWGDYKFKELAESLVNLYPVRIIFIGSHYDKQRIENLLKEINMPEIFSISNLSLEELPALIEKLSLFVAVDTGPIYIAHALGVPLIDIIGPVDPSEQPPTDKISIQVLPPNRITPSSFVFKAPGRTEEHEKAIESIGVSDVVDASKKLLEDIYNLEPMQTKRV